MSAALQGFDHGAASGALYNLEHFKGLRKQKAFSALMEGWILSSAWVSNVVGNLAALQVATPRLALLLAAVLEAGGSLLTGLAPTLPWLIAGRMINGLGLGLTGVAVGQYTSEIAPPRVRAGAISCQETNFVFGALIGALAGRHWLRAPGGWRLIWGLASAIGALSFAAMLCMPDTPRSIYKQAVAAAGRQPAESAEAAQARILAILEAARREAASAMCSLRGLQAPDAALEVEIEAIERTYAAELGLRGRARPAAEAGAAQEDDGPAAADLREEWGQEERSLAQILNSDVRRRLLFIGCFANMLPALSGQEALMNYATQTFNLVGFNLKDGASFTAGLFALKLMTTLPDFLWIDSFGRRTLLSAGLGAISASYSAAFMVLACGGRPAFAGGALAVSALAYQGLVGPLCWVVSTELYPSDMRTRGCAWAAVTYSLTTALSVQFHPLLMQRGPFSALAVYGATCQAAWLLSDAVVPETQGRSLEQIQDDAFSGRLFGQGTLQNGIVADDPFLEEPLSESLSEPPSDDVRSGTMVQSGIVAHDPFLEEPLSGSLSEPPSDDVRHGEGAGRAPREEAALQVAPAG